MTTQSGIIQEMHEALRAAEARLEYTRRLLRELEELRVPPGLFDYKHEDAISYDVPPGYDTILGYLAKNHPDVLDTFDYSVPEATQRDGWKLSHLCSYKDLKVYVDAPKCLQIHDIYQVRAYPVALLQQRWG